MRIFALLAGLLLSLNVAYAQTRASYVSRAEAALLLLNEKGLPSVDDTVIYPDVIASEWYNPYVRAAIDMKLWFPDTFSNRAYPHKLISRGEFLHMLVNTYDLSTYGQHAYLDVGPNTPYGQYAPLAAEYKLFLDPTDPRRLRLDLPVRHEEAAKALQQLLSSRPELREPKKIQLKKVIVTVGTQVPKYGSPLSVPSLASYTVVTSKQAVQQALQNLLYGKQTYADRISEQIIARVNQERATKNLVPLKRNEKLEAAAKRYAKDMHERGYFSHYTPEGVGYVDRIKAAGYTDVDPVACGCEQVTNPENLSNPQTLHSGENYVIFSADACTCRPQFALGENLAKGQSTVDQVMTDWLNSPTHKRNIMQPAFREIGIGIFRNIWVQEFGRFEL